MREGVETGRILPGQWARPCDRKTLDAAPPHQPPKTPLDTEAEHSQTCWVQTESATAGAKRLPGLQAWGVGVGGLLSNVGWKGWGGQAPGPGRLGAHTAHGEQSTNPLPRTRTHNKQGFGQRETCC